MPGGPAAPGAQAGCPLTVTRAPVASATRAAPNSWPGVHAPGLVPARTRRAVSAAMAAVARTPSPAISSATATCPSGATTSAQVQEPVPRLGAVGSGDVCHDVGGTAGPPGRLEVTDGSGQHLPLGAPEGQDPGAAAEALPDHLAVAVGDGDALRQGLLDCLAHPVALAGHLRGGCDTHEVGHRAQLHDQAQDQCLGRGRPNPAPVTSVTACVRACSSRSSSPPHRRPFVGYVHIGHSSGKAGVDDGACRANGPIVDRTTPTPTIA